MWSFGCLLAELAINKPLFIGECEIQQLFEIFELTGTPTEYIWNIICESGPKSFPLWKSQYFPYIGHRKNSTEYKTIKKAFSQRPKSWKKLQKLS